MEKFTQEGVDTQSEIPEEFRSFYSDDPYEVLGVSQNATMEEVSKARNVAQKRFHPNLNHGLSAAEQARNEEISKRLNIAHDRIEKGDKTTSSNNGSKKRSTSTGGFGFTPNDFDFKPRGFEDLFGGHTPESKQTVESVQNRLLSSLDSGFDSFKEWYSDAESVGITKERIKVLLSSESSQEAISRQVAKHITKLYKQGSGSQAPTWFGYECEIWKKLGVDFNVHLTSPEVHKLLADEAMNILKNNCKDGPDNFSEFVKSWNKLGANLGSLAGSEPFTLQVRDNLVVNYVMAQVSAPMILGVNWTNPSRFTAFVQVWKKAGFDTNGILDSEKAKEFLEKKTKDMLAYESRYRTKYSTSSFKSFVNFWMQVGWNPSDEIKAGLDKK